MVLMPNCGMAGGSKIQKVKPLIDQAASGRKRDLTAGAFGFSTFTVASAPSDRASAPLDHRLV